jgi:aspartyl-tRNA(Asn)/glutamyl-tRNA(Gln) amidotransferase subunit A
MTGSPGDLSKLSAVALAAALRERKVSSEEATAATLERLAAAHELTHCVITMEKDEALAAAKSADKALAAGTARGALAGVPLAHKDMFDRAGKIASWGAKIRADKPAARDATVIARLKEAGSIQVAALHLTEFALGPTGHNYVLGHARNPWDPTRVTGGSSAGTAAAVAYGAIPAGLGSDTAGSLRVPAACCGVVSIKPTWCRISRAGAMPLAPCLDTVGYIARHVEDLAMLLGVSAGPDPRDPATPNVPVPNYMARLGDPVRGLKIGVDAALIADAHPDVQKLVEASLAVLAKIGLERRACTFANWQAIDHLTQLCQLAEAASAHDHYLRSRSGDYGPQVRARLEAAHFVPGVDHMTAKRARGTILKRTLDTTFKDCDVAILPVLPDPLPTIAELDVAGSPSVAAQLGRFIRFTRVINYLGLPTLVLPTPRNGGLPNGIQIVGRPFAEAQLLAIGKAYQREVPPEIAQRLQ